MTETEKAVDILNRIGVYQRAHNNTDYWVVNFGHIGFHDFIMVKREPKSRYFYVCRSFYGDPYTGKLEPFALFDDLAGRHPYIAKKLAEPME